MFCLLLKCIAVRCIKLPFSLCHYMTSSFSETQSEQILGFSTVLSHSIGLRQQYDLVCDIPCENLTVAKGSLILS